jgi:hypothetical protein
LLWNAKRVPDINRHDGDLRWDHPELTQGDPGFIYRIPEVTSITIPAKFIRELFAGIIGDFWTSFLSLYLWLLLAGLFVVLTFLGLPRLAGFAVFLLALLAVAILVITRFDKVYPTYWLVPLVLLGVALWIWFSKPRPIVGRLVFGILAAASLITGLELNAFINGDLGPLSVGPIPAGTPVNLIMNINPEAPKGLLIDAGASLLRGSFLVSARGLKDKEALAAFEKEAGLPLLKASKCPDFWMDRGHWFGEALSDEEKHQLIAFLKTL